MKTVIAREYLAAAAMLCGLTLLSGTSAAESGELFPNVAPYDQTVSNPISQAEKTAQKPQPGPVAPTPTPVAPSPEPAAPQPAPPQPAPEIVTPAPDPNDPGHSRPVRVRIPKRRPGDPAAPATEPAPAPRPLIELTPFSTGLLAPMLSPKEQEDFTTQYGDLLARAVAGSVAARKKAAETFETAALTAATPTLKRYLLLHAFSMYIRASTPFGERVEKAEVLLPLLTEKTLPVVQARADALNDLMLSAASNPSDRFLDLYIDAHLTLAKLQVQAGFPRDAQDSLKKARDAALHSMHKTPARIDQINETAAWCERSSAAAALWPKFQATLKASPNDSFTNNMMATFHLALYGNLANALPFAARSDRKDLKALAEVLKANPPQALSTDPARHAEQILTIASALVDVAKATSAAQPFDRYSIACYAGDHVDEMLSETQVPADKIPQAQAILAAAKSIVDKTNLKRGDDLPRWLAGASTPAGKPGGAHSIATLGDVFRGLPKDLLPTEMGWTDNQRRAVNDWLTKNIVGLTFDGDALADRIDEPVDAPGGKIYVPVIFGLPIAALTENVGITTSIELRMSAKLAARAKDLQREQSVAIKGSIVSAHVFYEGASRAHLQLVVINKAD